MAQTEGDQEAIDREAAIRQGLQKLGWTEGRNIQIDTRLAGGNAERLQAHAAELVRLGPDVIVASATSALDALQKATRIIPIIFAQVTDPVGAGFVASLARPGGNITGFTQQEFSIGVKWLELLKEIAPRVNRVGLIYDPGNPAAAGYFAAIEPGASAFVVQLSKFA